MEIVDSTGRRLSLEKKLFRGGEGSIHPVAGNPAVLAKLYHANIDARKQAKLAAMTRSAQLPLLRVAAWPSATLHAGAGGRMVGFLMPRFDGQRSELHQLYTPATRKQTFSKADWAFLIHAARNVAAAMDTVHAAGHVVGDVNQRNFIVGADGTVKVLDCDSFQIRDGGRTFLCEVGMPEFTPPELQNRPLSGIERTPNHDAFGLAVLCFQLLFMGRHPFAGRFLGRGEMPIERAIAEGRFAFGRDSRSRQMDPPPNMLSFESLPPRLIALFEAAFTGTDPRPTARDWTRALDTVQSEIRACTAEPVHKYYKALTHCTWCELESAAGVYFFIGVISSSGTFDVTMLWAEIVALTGLPYEAPVRPSVHAVGTPPLDSDLRKRPKAMAAKIVSMPLLIGAAALSSNPMFAFGFLLALIVAIALPLPGAAERKRRLKRVRECERVWADAYRCAEAEVSLEPLLVKHDELQTVRTAYESLAAQRQAELQEMTQNARAIQLQRYLQQQLIRSHSISDIGPKRKATLAMWGIATAADVTIYSLAPVQGFGPTLKTKLLAWRAVLEQRFVFNAKEAIPKPDRDAFEYRWQRHKLDLERQLRAGAEQARRINESIRQRRAAVARTLETPASDWARARADLDAMDIALKGEHA